MARDRDFALAEDVPPPPPIHRPQGANALVARADANTTLQKPLRGARAQPGGPLPGDAVVGVPPPPPMHRPQGVDAHVVRAAAAAHAVLQQPRAPQPAGGRGDLLPLPQPPPVQRVAGDQATSPSEKQKDVPDASIDSAVGREGESALQSNQLAPDVLEKIRPPPRTHDTQERRVHMQQQQRAARHQRTTAANGDRNSSRASSLEGATSPNSQRRFPPGAGGSNYSSQATSSNSHSQSDESLHSHQQQQRNSSARGQHGGSGSGSRQRTMTAAQQRAHLLRSQQAAAAQVRAHARGNDGGSGGGGGGGGSVIDISSPSGGQDFPAPHPMANRLMAQLARANADNSILRAEIVTLRAASKFPPSSSLTMSSGSGHTDNSIARNGSKTLRHFCHVKGCQKSYASFSNLRRHEQEAHTLKKYRCEVPGCAYVGTTQDRLKDHVFRKHQNKAKAYRCDFAGCSFASERKQHLKEHLRVAHREGFPKYSCTFPGCVFKTMFEKNLKRHAANHLAKGPPTLGTVEALQLQIMRYFSATSDPHLVHGDALTSGGAQVQNRNLPPPPPLERSDQH